MANDNLNNAFTSFDGFMARRAALAGASSSSGNELSVTAAADQPAGGASAVPSEMSLIDMDSLPAMTTTAAPVVATGAMSLGKLVPDFSLGIIVQGRRVEVGDKMYQL